MATRVTAVIAGPQPVCMSQVTALIWHKEVWELRMLCSRTPVFVSSQ